MQRVLWLGVGSVVGRLLDSLLEELLMALKRANAHDNFGMECGALGLEGLRHMW